MEPLIDVRWTLAELPSVLERAGASKPFLIASERWSHLDIPYVDRTSEVPSEAVAFPAVADSVIAVGGGSAIDMGKNVSSTYDVPLISIPTTYSGAEWTPSFGIRTADRKLFGHGSGAHLAGIVYDVWLTIDLPLAETVGTAMNALDHCAEALYVNGRNDAATEKALTGAELIARALPRVVADPRDVDERRVLLHGAAAGGEALALAGLGLAHAIAQAVGGAYGAPHGAMNALALPPALRFVQPDAPDAVAAFGRAIGDEADPAGAVERLVALGEFGGLRDFGVPEDELASLAEAAAQRVGNQQNPRPATPAEIEQMLRSIW